VYRSLLASGVDAHIAWLVCAVPAAADWCGCAPRMFYHLPTYAILDECTSAVSDDVTDKIYETCANLGITLFTIAHQKTVIKHHKLVLRFDGKGGWKLQSSAQDPMWGDRT
jgi:hypothetical protein